VTHENKITALIWNGSKRPRKMFRIANNVFEISNPMYLKFKIHCKISGSRGGEYEDGCLLGCCAV
jgi:hypothetical protein